METENWVTDAASEAYNTVGEHVSNLWDKLPGAASEAYDTAEDYATKLWNSLPQPHEKVEAEDSVTS